VITIRTLKKTLGMDETIQRRATSVADACSGRPHCSNTGAKKQINQSIRDNRRHNGDKNVPEVSISYGKKLYKNGLSPNQKRFILTQSGNVWTAGPNAMKGREIIFLEYTYI
jgi:hypothetical protein